jgi:hypothetical protein
MKTVKVRVKNRKNLLKKTFDNIYKKSIQLLDQYSMFLDLFIMHFLILKIFQLLTINLQTVLLLR